MDKINHNIDQLGCNFIFYTSKLLFHSYDAFVNKLYRPTPEQCGRCCTQLVADCNGTYELQLLLIKFN